MEKLDYLKNHLLTNIPLVVKITKRVGQYPETDYNTGAKTGRTQTLYNFTLPDGQTVRHYAKEREEETLMHFSAGEEVQVVRQEADKNGKRITFLVWTPTEGAEARAAAKPQVQSNTRETATKREMKEHKEEQEEKSIAISLQGFMQAYVSGQGASYDEGKEDFLVRDAILFAVQAREACLKKAHEIHAGPSLKEELDAFGDDTSPFPESPIAVEDLPF